MNQMLDVVLYGGLAGLATIIGIVIVLYHEKWARRHSLQLVSFAAGTLLAAAFVEIIPEALTLYGGALLAAFAGFVFFYLLENAVMIHSCLEGGCAEHKFSVVSMLGLGFHSLLDGVAIGVGFEIGTALGLVTTFAVLAHELPEGISATGIMLHAKAKRTKVVAYSVAVALATPLGAIASYLLFKGADPSILGALLAVAAGSFIYVAASDMIPETHRKFNKSNVAALLLGIAAVFAFGIFVSIA